MTWLYSLELTQLNLECARLDHAREPGLPAPLALARVSTWAQDMLGVGPLTTSSLNDMMGLAVTVVDC